MENLDDLLKYYPEKEADGVKGWWWIIKDHGLWDGPSTDFLEFKPIIEQLCKSKNTVIQAGGGGGMYARLFSRMFAEVYTFEPHELNYRCLVKNCHDIPNIHHFNFALGERFGTVTMKKLDEGNCGVIHTTEDPGPTKMIHIDSLKLKNVSLIQLDTEGYELHILRGAMETISEWHPVIQIERPGNEINELLAPYGYMPRNAAKADTFYI